MCSPPKDCPDHFQDADRVGNSPNKTPVLITSNKKTHGHMSRMSLFSAYVSTQIGSQFLITFTELKQKGTKRTLLFAALRIDFFI